MALVDCKACEAEISKKAKSCPQCGEPQRRTSILTKVVLCLVVLSVIGSIFDKEKSGAPRMCGFVECNTASMTIARAQVAVKDAMRDPDSADFGKVVYTESGAVCGRVNGRNGFGGMTGQQEFIYIGGALSMQDDSRKFSSAWNKLCTGKATTGF